MRVRKGLRREGCGGVVKGKGHTEGSAWGGRSVAGGLTSGTWRSTRSYFKRCSPYFVQSEWGYISHTVGRGGTG